MHQHKQSVEVARGDLRITGQLAYGEGYEPDALPYSLTLEIEGESFESGGDDLFDCLLSVRRNLEERDLQICVNGACINVWPSSMARSMGGGLRAYRMTIGKQAHMKDLVDIFAMAEGGRLGTIAEQMQYRADWFKSLGA